MKVPLNLILFGSTAPLMTCSNTNTSFQRNPPSENSGGLHLATPPRNPQTNNPLSVVDQGCRCRRNPPITTPVIGRTQAGARHEPWPKNAAKTAPRASGRGRRGDSPETSTPSAMANNTQGNATPR
ncbi:serine protease SplB [Striga asiatica]|uniref:Serine protease SplB n=1 Tax=Striga asiatica TaxID=4170 RepID=A0A5A7QPX7_STRAF|nr:serine protease SplB [Striga asiatica]